MAFPNVVDLVVRDAQTAVDGVAELAGKPSILVYSIDSFVEHLKSTTAPFVGIWYEGIFPYDNKTGTGLAATIHVSLLFSAGRSKFTRVTDNKTSTTATLDAIRGSMRLRVSPTGHKWFFISEIPSHITDEHIIYVQRWATHVAL